MDYTAIVSRLNSHTPSLYPEDIWQPSLSAAIGDWNEPAADAEMQAACRAGLLLWNDDLDASHRVAQDIETPTGSFWHAIMHRREGDGGNSKYWWARTGRHPAFAGVRDAVLETLSAHGNGEAVAFRRALEQAGTWTPEVFVDCCEAWKKSGGDDAWLRAVQLAEMRALLDWCHAATNP